MYGVHLVSGWALADSPGEHALCICGYFIPRYPSNTSQIPRSIQTRVSCEYSLPIKCFSFLLQDGEESVPLKQNSSTKSCRKTMCTSNRNVHYSVHFYLCRISLVYYSARNAQTIGCNNCTFTLSPKQTLGSPVCSSFANNHTPKYLLHSCVADICHGRHCSSCYSS